MIMCKINISDNRIDVAIKKKKNIYRKQQGSDMAIWLNMNLLPEKCKRRQVCQAEGCTAEVICHPLLRQASDILVTAHEVALCRKTVMVPSPLQGTFRPWRPCRALQEPKVSPVPQTAAGNTVNSSSFSILLSYNWKVLWNYTPQKVLALPVTSFRMLLTCYEHCLTGSFGLNPWGENGKIITLSLANVASQFPLWLGKKQKWEFIKRKQQEKVRDCRRREAMFLR